MNTQTAQTDCSKCFRFHTGECPPPPVTAVLPATGAVVPVAAAALVIRPTGHMSTRDGEAFTADVLRDGELVGTIEQDGHGGGTYFHHRTFEISQWWSELVNEYAAISERHRFVAHEALCDDLYEEVALTREMNRARNARFRVGGAPDPASYESPKIYRLNGKDSDAARAFIRRECPDDVIDVWVKGTGWVQI